MAALPHAARGANARGWSGDGAASDFAPEFQFDFGSAEPQLLPFRQPVRPLRRDVVIDLSRLAGRVRHSTPSGIDRVEHAYLSMPLSGAFFTMLWVPPEFRAALGWIPTVPMFELLRLGMFDGYPPDYAGVAWPIACCGLLTLVGLAGLRILRPRVQLA